MHARGAPLRVGIVIPAYNVGPYIGDAIRSLLAQSWSDWQAVVVDDGSSDETYSIAAGFGDPRLTIVQQANAGVSAARNHGAAILDADAVLFLDADDWLASDALAVLVRTLRAAPGAVAAAGRSVRAAQDHARGTLGPPPPANALPQGKGKAYLGRAFILAAMGSCRARQSRSWPSLTRPAQAAGEMQHPELRDVAGSGPAITDPVSGRNPLPSLGIGTSPRASVRDLLPTLLIRNPFTNGGQVLVRTRAARAAGAFRTDLRFGEDWEYWTRIALLGRVAVIRDIICHVRERAGSAYETMATEPATFEPCMHAIFGNPDLLARFGLQRLARLRRRAEAENHWVIGRELIRHGSGREGRQWLTRSVLAEPSPKRLLLLGAAYAADRLPPSRRGRFRPYSVAPSRTL